MANADNFTFLASLSMEDNALNFPPLEYIIALFIPSP